MDYRKIYNNIIQTARASDRKKSKGVLFENHHIIPKSINGSNDAVNLVLLTPKEHYICHRLLVEIYRGTEYESKMYYAMWCMINGLGNQKRYATSSRIYQHFKLSIHHLQSKNRYDNRKPVEQYDLDGNFISIFDSPLSAAEVTGVSRGSIENCARGENLSGGGYNWRYVNSDKIIKPVVRKKCGVKKGNIPYNKGKQYPMGTRNIIYKTVNQYSTDGIFIKQWNSIMEASLATNISRSSIENCAGPEKGTAGGFIWAYRTSFDNVEPRPYKKSGRKAINAST